MIETEEGMEIYLRQPSRYNIDAGRRTAFAEVAELARMRRETAIGFVTAAGEVRLSPRAGLAHRFCDGSRVITISEE